MQAPALVTQLFCRRLQSPSSVDAFPVLVELLLAIFAGASAPGRVIVGALLNIAATSICGATNFASATLKYSVRWAKPDDTSAFGWRGASSIG